MAKRSQPQRAQDAEKRMDELATEAGKGAKKKPPEAPPEVPKVRTMMQMPADIYGKIQTLVGKQKAGGERGASLSRVVTKALEEFFNKGKGL